jgi:hypothetical protein
MKPIALNQLAPRWIDAAGAVGFLALGAAFYFFVVAPTLQRRDVLAARHAELATKSGEMDRATSLLAQVESRRSEVARAVASSPLRLQDALHTNRRLGEIGELASRCDLKVNEIQPHGVQIGTKVNIVPIRLAGRGSFGNCLRFLHSLRGEFLDVGVLSVVLEGNPSDRSPTASFELRLKWHTTPGEALAASTPGRPLR